MERPQQAQFAQGVVVLVEGLAVEAERDPAAAAHHLGDRRDPGAEREVGRGVDGDDAAGLGDHLQFVRPGMDAMGEGQPRREQPDLAPAPHEAAGIGPVGPVALVPGLEEMRRDPAPGAGGGLGDRLPERVRAPLRPVRGVLHVDHRATDRGGDRLDAGELLGERQHGGEEARLDLRPRLGVEGVQHRPVVAVDQGLRSRRPMPSAMRTPTSRAARAIASTSVG